MLFAALAVRLLLEAVLLPVLAIWGYQSVDGVALKLLAGLAAAAGAALLWGLFISPNRRIELGRIPRLVLELALFGLAAAALWRMGWPVASALLLATECADRFGLIFLRRRQVARRYAGR